MIQEYRAPIILYTYNRPEHTLRTLEALSRNEQANESILYIFCDGAKADSTRETLQKIEEVKQIVASKLWCKEVHITEREKNYGLADNIVDGVSSIIKKHGKVIVLEDDIVTSSGFLKYMNDALNIYEKQKSVMHISGFFPKTKKQLPETFFYNVTTCWGWATWQRAWRYYENNAGFLLQRLSQKGYDEYDFNGAQKDLLYQQLINNATGTLKTWAVKWHASVYLQNGYCLHPNKSLTNNIGHDSTGENSGIDNPYQHAELKEHIEVTLVPIKKNLNAYKEIEKIYQQSFIKRIIPEKVKEKIKTLLNSKTRKDYFEKRRLYKTPRFQKGSANFLQNPFYFVDAATFLHGFEEIFEQEIYKFKAGTDTPNIIDCGSNIGLSVVYFKLLYSQSKVTAFEPDKKIAQTLKENIKSFKLDNVEVNEKAIWINNDGIEFQEEGGFSGRIPKPGDTSNIVKVPTKRLKDLLSCKVDFLKMDIEGAEYPVILDCAEMLKNVDNFFIEYHSHIKEEQNLHKILEILHTQGFRYHIHEAYTRKHPFISNESMVGMDLQLNIFAAKNK